MIFCGICRKFDKFHGKQQNAMANLETGNAIQSLKDISSIRDIHKTLKYVDEFSELKNDEIQKEHTSLSLDLSMHFDFPERTCTYASLSFSAYLHSQKQFGSRSDPNGIQERMFRQSKKLCML